MQHHVLELQREVLGELHPHIAQSLEEMALIYEAQGRQDEAKSLAEEAVRRARQGVGEEHPVTKTAITMLMRLYRHLGCFEEAEKLQQRILEARTRLLGPEHPLTLACLIELGNLLEEEGRLDEAVASWREVLARNADNIPSLRGIARAGRLKETFRRPCLAATHRSRASQRRCLWIERCEIYVYRREWKNAFADLDMSLQLERSGQRPREAVLELMRALIFLLADRHQEYRETCVAMLDRFARTQDSLDLHCAVRACLLDPAVAADVNLQKKLVKQPLFNDYTTAWGIYARGMAELRARQIGRGIAALSGIATRSSKMGGMLLELGRFSISLPRT